MYSVDLLLDDRNRLPNWYVKVYSVVNTPKTVWVDLTKYYKTFDDLINWACGKNIPHELIQEMEKTANWIGEYPLFMRTDLTSDKHNYEHTCYVKSKSKIKSNFIRLMEFSIGVVMPALVPKYVVFREFIELDWRFKWFIGNLPIAPEVRYFIRDGDIECWHFYWSEDVFIGSPKFNEIEDKLKEINMICTAEVDKHFKMAKKIAKIFNEGYYSIDFARTKMGKWYLIDMALGDVSYHPPHLKTTP